MITLSEGRQRIAMNRFTMKRTGPNGADYTIHPNEGNKRAGFSDYSSDDFEDVVLKSGSLRRG
jgi:hypothetical protein